MFVFGPGDEPIGNVETCRLNCLRTLLRKYCL